MLIGPGHPDWTPLVVDLYLRHPLANLGYTTVERYGFILAGSSKQHEWYTREIIQFHSHYGVSSRHDVEGCVYCDGGIYHRHFRISSAWLPHAYH
jgi:hypothetical protein